VKIRFHKSLRIGPIRLNFSKSGMGASIGVKGLRTGVRANGSRYTDVSLPGTGLSTRISHPRESEGELPPRRMSRPENQASVSLLWLLLIPGAILLLIHWFG
jgi:hypothetical protein